MLPWIKLGVSTGRSALGLCPTWNRPNSIGWQIDGPATNRFYLRVGSSQIFLGSSCFTQNQENSGRWSTTTRFGWRSRDHHWTWTENSRSPPDMGRDCKIYTGSRRKTQDLHSIWIKILRSPPDLGEKLEISTKTRWSRSEKERKGGKSNKSTYSSVRSASIGWEKWNQNLNKRGSGFVGQNRHRPQWCLGRLAFSSGGRRSSNSCGSSGS